MDIAERLNACLRFDAPTPVESELEAAARDAIGEIARLRDENARLRAERDDADRRAGAAEREQEHDREAAYARDSWLRRAKEQWGVGPAISFDVVWGEALALKSAAMQKGE